MARQTDPFSRAAGPVPAKPELRVLLASPRGFCAGVHRAIDAVRDAIEIHGAPVYVRRPIVHNLEVVRGLEAEGAIFVQELDEVPAGSVVLLSAHGSTPAIAEDARRRRLTAFDAVCPLVSKVHREVERHIRDGRQLILIGHRGHPEIEGTLGYAGNAVVHLVQCIDDIAAIDADDDAPSAYAMQTTFSVEDAAAIVDALHRRFSDLVGPSSSDICYATSNRQLAVRQIAGQADAVIIAGESFSSNANRLAEIAADLCRQVQLVATAADLDWRKIPPSGTIAISAAASTPDTAVSGILLALRDRFEVDLQEVQAVRETTVFKPLSLS